MEYNCFTQLTREGFLQRILQKPPYEFNVYTTSNITHRLPQQNQSTKNNMIPYLRFILLYDHNNKIIIKSVYILIQYIKQFSNSRVHLLGDSDNFVDQN